MHHVAAVNGTHVLKSVPRRLFSWKMFAKGCVQGFWDSRGWGQVLCKIYFKILPPSLSLQEVLILLDGPGLSHTESSLFFEFRGTGAICRKGICVGGGPRLNEALPSGKAECRDLKLYVNKVVCCRGHQSPEGHSRPLKKRDGTRMVSQQLRRVLGNGTCLWIMRAWIIFGGSAVWILIDCEIIQEITGSGIITKNVYF